MRSSALVPATVRIDRGAATARPLRPMSSTDTRTTAAEEPVDPALAGTVSSSVDGEDLDRPPGATLGRYVLLGKLGAGAMGVVYLAHDAELDRRVAIKLLRVGLDDARLRLRLVREAQAMARLNHPNVVTVHDVGEDGGQIFVAMEEVRGVTLRAFLAERPRRWREILEIFIAVGRGLAAAHNAGIVHRDFKADNVMIDVDGRPRVMDFGLARADAAPAVPRASTGFAGAEGASSIASASMGSPLSITLTQAGALVGTPVYMAPELWKGAAADARSDQFSFCVALWEALYGERPFAGATLAALASAVTKGPPPTPADPGRAPSRVRAALLRGLAQDPAARWPTLDALLVALDRERRRTAVRWFVAGSLAALSVAVVGLAGDRVAASQAVEAKSAACRAKADALHPEWDAWATVRALAALPRGATAADVTRLRAAIAAFEGDLLAVRRARREVCREPSDPILAAPWIEPRIDRCFERVAHDLELSARRIESGDPAAIFGVDRETDTRPCTEAAAILHEVPGVPEDPATFARWRELRTRLDDVRIAEGTIERGAIESGYAAVIAEAAAIGEPTLEREAKLSLAAYEFSIGAPRRAHAALQGALEGSLHRDLHGVDGPHLGLDLVEGVVTGDARIRIAAELVTGDERSMVDGSLTEFLWRASFSRPFAAELTWRDLGLDRPALLRYRWRVAYEAREEARARLYLLAGDPALARSHALKGLEIAADRPRPLPGETSSLYQSLGEAELRLGSLAAESTLEAALAASDPAQVSVARRGHVLLTRAELELTRRSIAEASRRLDEAEALREAAAADDEAYPSRVDLVAGQIAAARGAHAEARARLTRARGALLASTGFLRARLADVDLALANLAVAEGRLEDAEDSIAEALAIRRQLLGEDNIAVVLLLDLRAEVEGHRGDADAAEATRAQAAALRGAYTTLQIRRAEACGALAAHVSAADPRDPRARAEARPLYEACEAAGVAGHDLHEIGAWTSPR